MKLSDVVGTRQLLEKIAGIEMNANEAVGFATWTVEVLKDIQAFDVKRAELFRKYGEEQGEGADARLVIPEANTKKFNAAMKRLLNKDVEVEPFDLSSLNIHIAPADLINALPLFK